MGRKPLLCIYKREFYKRNLFLQKFIVQIIPAIDLKDNKCVRLTEGKDETSLIFNESPEVQATYFQDIGCKKIHIVDLDAAFGRENINLPTIKKIRNVVSIPLQLGGGIRSKEQAIKYFDLGINNLIIGSMSVHKPEIVRSLSEEFKEKIYISLDLKDDNVMLKGWKEISTLNINEIINIYNKTNIKGFIITDIKNDGMLKGLDINFIKKLFNILKNNNSDDKSVIIAGGLTNYTDLTELKNLNLKNLEGIISGKSFYVGNIDLKKAQKILNSNG